MTELIKIDAVEPLDGSWLRLTFSDGAVKEVDVGEILARGGVFEPIRKRPELFEQVRVNPQTQTIEWPGEVDLDPEVLYGRFRARVRRQYSSARGSRAHRDERIDRFRSAACGRVPLVRRGSPRCLVARFRGTPGPASAEHPGPASHRRRRRPLSARRRCPKADRMPPSSSSSPS